MRVSVYIPSYNQERVLQEAIESVLAQSMALHEIIIVDDASTDGSPRLISQYHSKYPDLIKPIYHDQNQGIARTRLTALRAVTGDYVTYVDGDDRLLPSKIEKELNALLAHSSAQIAFSNNYYINRDGSERLGRWIEDGAAPHSGDVFAATFARRFPRGNLFRMELVNYAALRRVGFHDASISLYEDFDMRIRMTKHLQTVYVDEPLSEIRVHGHGLSSSPADRHFEALEYIYRKNRSLLNDLPMGERKEIIESYQSLLSKTALSAAKEASRSTPNPREVGKGRALVLFCRALRYDLSSFDLRLAARLLLPAPPVRRTHPDIEADR